MTSPRSSNLILHFVLSCLVFICATIPICGQAVDPLQLDSLKRAIERDRNTIRKEQDEILKKQDSLLQASKMKIPENTRVHTSVNGERVGDELPLQIPVISFGVAMLLLLILRKWKKSASLPRE